MNAENESDVHERPAHRVSQVLVVLNPSAGNSNPERIQKAFRKHFANFRIHELGGEANTGKAIGEALAEGFDVIVAAGGDGTVASVASELVGKSAVKVKTQKGSKKAP